MLKVYISYPEKLLLESIQMYLLIFGMVFQIFSAILNIDPDKRPNLNQIIQYPIIKDRFTKLLNEDDFEDEFSYTILHN
jgi:hypothetical protein